MALKHQIKLSEKNWKRLGVLAYELYALDTDAFKTRPNQKCATYDDAVSYLFRLYKKSDSSKMRDIYLRNTKADNKAQRLLEEEEKCA